MSSLSVVFGLSTEGKTVAEALIADAAQAHELVAAARQAGSQLAWAHSAADLSALGFSRQWGYRMMAGQAPPAGAADSGSVAAAVAPIREWNVMPLEPAQDTPELWAAAYRGQWGHKTPSPDQWPFDLPPGTITLALVTDGMTAGVCRVDPAAGLIDGPGLMPAHREEPSGYESLLRGALALVMAPEVTVESWGEGPDRVAICERLGLTTAEYKSGWEFVLRGDPAVVPPEPYGTAEAGE